MCANDLASLAELNPLDPVPSLVPFSSLALALGYPFLPSHTSCRLHHSPSFLYQYSESVEQFKFTPHLRALCNPEASPTFGPSDSRAFGVATA
jgi:hypothetical protein